MLVEAKDIFERKNMQNEHGILGYRVHLYFHD